MEIRDNSLSLGISFKRTFSTSFSWEVFVLRASANSTLDFFNNRTQLESYVSDPANEVNIATDWSKIETYAAGLKGHFHFINSSHHFFSVALGAGVYNSASSIQFFTEATISPEGILSDFVTEEETETKSEFFILPSIQYSYIFNGGYSLGIEFSALLDQDSAPLLTQPVLANYYNIAIALGKQF